MSHRVIHDWDEHRFHRVISDAFQMPTGAQSGYIIQGDANGNFSWVPAPSGGGGSTTQFWQDTGTALQPLSPGRGVSLGTPGGLSINGSRLHIEGPNGVEVVGLSLQPIGSIFPVAGMMQWTGTLLQFHDGTKWNSIGGTLPDPGGGPNPVTIGYWIDDAVTNEMRPYITGRNIRLAEGADLYLNNAHTARLVGSPTGLYLAGPSVNFLNGSNQPIAQLSGTGNFAVYPPSMIPVTTERMTVVGGIVIGPALDINVGTIQYAGGHFQGRNATGWVNLDAAGGGIPGVPGSGGNPLAPTGVVPGVYGDAADIPQLTIAVDGRITFASNISLASVLPSALGPATGDLNGTWPSLFLNALVPPIPAGTWGGPAAIPQLTVDAKGRVTHATQNVIRPGLDGMTRIHVTDGSNPASLPFLWKEIAPNSEYTWLTSSFTPLATGRGWINGTVQGYLFNSGADPGVGTLHVCWLTLKLFLDGVLVEQFQRSINVWEPASGHAVSQPVEIPFHLPWAASVGALHQLVMKVDNFGTYDFTVIPYSMTYHLDFGEWIISEDPQPGIGTNSSYLLSGAVAGPVSAGVVGSWIAVYPFTLPGGLGGSWGYAKTPATAEVDFNIQRNGTVIGTIRWLAGANTAAFNFPNPVAVNVGDLIEVIGAAGVGDTTWTLRGLL